MLYMQHAMEAPKGQVLKAVVNALVLKAQVLPYV